MSTVSAGAGADSGGSASTRPTSSAGSRSTSAAPAAASPSSPRSSASSASSASSGAADADPLLDPRADAADAAWAARARPRGGGPETDVRLACPSCFALLCVAAQAHVEYEGQWRAVFVRGCRASETEVVRAAGDGGEAARERYWPVECERCLTEVGVLDKDEVYHFCNVLS